MYHQCAIKFGGITNLTDARYAAAIYARWIGFNLVPNTPRYIEPAKAKEIIDWLSGPEMVAELGAALPDDAHEALQVLGIQSVQINEPDHVEVWKQAGYSVILEGEHALADFSISPEKSPASNHILDITAWSMDALEALDPEELFAINITGGDETVPGMRDFAEIDDILELFALEEE